MSQTRTVVVQEHSATPAKVGTLARNHSRSRGRSLEKSRDDRSADRCLRKERHARRSREWRRKRARSAPQQAAGRVQAARVPSRKPEEGGTSSGAQGVGRNARPGGGGSRAGEATSPSVEEVARTYAPALRAMVLVRKSRPSKPRWEPCVKTSGRTPFN